MDLDGDDVHISNQNVTAIGSSSPTNSANDIQDDASGEDSSDTQRRSAPQKVKKTAKKSSLSVAYEKSQHAYTMSTFKNKLGIARMEAFLSRPEFGINLAIEFPPRATMSTTFYDSDNNPISRAEAIETKCHEMNQILIDSHKASMAEEASRKVDAKRVFEGHRHDFPDVAPDSPRTMLARIDTQTIRDHASIQIKAAYDNNMEPAGELTEPELGSDNLPLISATVQRLVYKVVDAQIRGNRTRTLHVFDSGDRRFHIPVEYGQLRFKLRNELRGSLTLEEDVDRAWIARKLVVQEFPPQP
ncbi:hypothetical protein PMIN03_009157 [Paraphaeosphaeria minitans]